MGVNALIGVISQHSNKYGDKLIDFMERYGITGLIDATEEQLTEYIKEKFSEVAE